MSGSLTSFKSALPSNRLPPVSQSANSTLDAQFLLELLARGERRDDCVQHEEGQALGSSSPRSPTARWSSSVASTRSPLPVMPGSVPLGGMTTFGRFLLNPVLLSNAEISLTERRERPITAILCSA